MNEPDREKLNLKYLGQATELDRADEEGDFSLARVLLSGLQKPAGEHLLPAIPMVKSITQLDRSP